MKLCLGCGKPLEEIGGRRIIRTMKGGVVLCNVYESFYLGNGFSVPAYFHKFKDDQRLMIVWGEFLERIYKLGTIKEKMQIIEYKVREEGKRPWVCQKCIGYALCSKCGEPLVDAPHASVLKDNGCVTHVPILGVRRPCSNPECEGSKQHGTI